LLPLVNPFTVDDVAGRSEGVDLGFSLGTLLSTSAKITATDESGDKRTNNVQE
jgi:hypothetical protein